MLRDGLLFLIEGIRERRATGALFPTSRWASRSLISPILQNGGSSGLRILEIGPGTGAVTFQILEHMGPNDSLALCEMNPRFVEELKKRLSKNQHFKRHESLTSFYTCPIQELPAECGQFDLIVCAIPFLNLNLSIVQEIFMKIKSLSHKDTQMTYYEYMWLRSLGTMLYTDEARFRVRELDRFFKNLFQKHLVKRHVEYRNVLPVYVYQLHELTNLQPIAESQSEVSTRLQTQIT